MMKKHESLIKMHAVFFFVKSSTEIHQSGPGGAGCLFNAMPRTCIPNTIFGVMRRGDERRCFLEQRVPRGFGQVADADLAGEGLIPTNV
jgi:hypothetical protein